MLFHNCGDRNLNLDLTASLHSPSVYLSRRSIGLYKDPSKIITKFVDFDEPTESDRYIGDLSIDEDIEKNIEIGFFDQLKTPSDEVKGFTPIDESNPLVSGIIAAAAAAFNNNKENNQQANNSNTEIDLEADNSIVPSSGSPYYSDYDTEMDEDRKPIHLHPHQHHQHHHQQPNNTDSLMTPVIDPNSPLATTGPTFPSFDVNTDNVFGQYLQELSRSVNSGANEVSNNQQDIKPFSLVTSLSTTSHVHNQPQQNQHHHQQQQSHHQQSMHQQQPVIHHHQSNDHRPSTSYSLSATSGNDYDYLSSLPGVSGYQSTTSQHCGDLETGTTTTTTTNATDTPSSSLTPSSSASSMSYAELKPRSFSFSHSQPSTSLSTDNLVPTVIEDHPYTSRNTSSPFSHRPSFSPPSSCPSTSSLASTVDNKDSTRDLLALYADEASRSPSRKKHSHDDSSSSSRKGRMTKKEKLDRMINEEKRLENENSMLKEQLKVMEHQFKVLQTKITSILIDAAKRKS